MACRDVSALRYLPLQPTPLLRFLACEAAFATENTPEVRLPPPHIAVEHTDACQLDIRCAARAAGHRSTCDVVGQEGAVRHHHWKAGALLSIVEW